MTKQEPKGKREQVEGEVREEVGKIAGDKAEQIKDKDEKAEGITKD